MGHQSTRSARREVERRRGADMPILQRPGRRADRPTRSPGQREVRPTNIAAMPAPTNEGGPRTRVHAAVVVLGCVVGQSFARFSFGLLLPAVKNDLHISYGIAGWLGTMNLGAYLIGTALTSVASLRYPAHRVMQSGIIVATVGIAVLAIAPTTAVLLAGMFICGIGGAASWVPAPAVAAAAFPPERRGFAMGLCSAGIGVGIIIATELTTAFRSAFNRPDAWRPIWAIEAGVGALVAVTSLRTLRPVPISPGAPPKLSTLRQVPRWWSPTAAYTCFGLGYVLFAVFVVAALQHDAHFSAGHASQVFALMGLGNAIGALSIGRLSDRIGRRTTMIVSFAAAAVPCLVVLTGREPFVALSAVLFGTAMSGSVVSIAAYIGDHTRPQDFSAAFGVVTLCFGVAQTIGPRLGGWMADHAGSFDHVFLVAAAAWFFGSVCAIGMPHRSRPSPGQRPTARPTTR